MDEIFTAKKIRRETEAIHEEKRRKSEQEFLHDLEVQEEERLKKVEAERKIERWSRSEMATYAECKRRVVKSESGKEDCVVHPGALRQYPENHRESILWMCCGKDPRVTGCTKTLHVDDSLSSEVSKLQARHETA
ncbi:hypothetical protein VTL71DRAFT_15346 [Oculimacula yallundae]|uniref:Uncharacterized protein n=1 Tax=Oculimacula yallundae TaxID=86028 RepID=A0ABR4CII4_9HELO